MGSSAPRFENAVEPHAILREEGFTYMSVVTEHAPGAPCWFELSTSDQNAAKQFYSEIFGWTVADSPMGPGAVYTMFKLGGQDVAAACTTQQPNIRPHWLIYFHAPDIDVTAAKAVELGGTALMPPFDVDTHGRMAVLRDPVGAAFALWKPGTNIGAGRVEEINTVGWTEHASFDTAASAKFYSELLGLVTKLSMEGEPPKYIEFGAGTKRLGGFLQMDAGLEHIPNHWSFYIVVNDCDATVARITELGGKVLHGPFDAPGVGRIGIVTDPQGAKFSVIALAAAA